MANYTYNQTHTWKGGGGLATICPGAGCVPTLEGKSILAGRNFKVTGMRVYSSPYATAKQSGSNVISLNP